MQTGFRSIGLGILAFVLGWALVLMAVPLWGTLLSVIAFPESRWGPEGTRIVAEACRLFTYALIVTCGAFFIALVTRRGALMYAFIASAGAVSAFVVPFAIAGIPLSYLEDYYREGVFFIVLLPLLTLAWSRTRWLTIDSRATL